MYAHCSDLQNTPKHSEGQKVSFISNNTVIKIYYRPVTCCFVAVDTFLFTIYSFKIFASSLHLKIILTCTHLSNKIVNNKVVYN